MARTESELDRSGLAKKLGDIKLEVNRINRFFERENLENPRAKPGIFSASGSATAHTSTDGPNGHRDDIKFQDHEYGKACPHSHDPGNCMHKEPLHRSHSFPHDYSHPRSVSFEAGRQGHGRLPKANFPQFDRENPRLWKSRCESYFEMYEVEQSMWIKMASMYFEGTAARWLQSAEKRVKQISWEGFCNLIHDRFGKEQHESLIRQLFHIKQTGTIADYVESFSALVDQLAAYEPTADPLYYTMRFVDGLKEDIKSVVMVQRPSDLDTACALAIVQEEALESRRKEHRRYEPSFNRTVPKNYSPSTLPSQLAKSLTSGKTEAKGESDRAGSSEEKFATLQAYRRARGLCDKCAEKWKYGHKCAPGAQLNAMQEIWELLALETETSEQDGEGLEFE
ncbi:hypothetical protein QOZ80_5BG0422000 [Eleusine coracana subsp. coracana]|nr:hypothetical protein QOZ80_5BG0422000 [Eleusine coracana subsp. coracana]